MLTERNTFSEKMYNFFLPSETSSPRFGYKPNFYPFFSQIDIDVFRNVLIDIDIVKIVIINLDILKNGLIDIKNDLVNIYIALYLPLS